MNQPKLTNKNIIISAAADGIGWCIAELCLNAGANVYISDFNEKKLSIRKQHEKYNSLECKPQEHFWTPDVTSYSH